MRRGLAVVVLLAAGCSNPDAGEVTPGIYSLEVTTLADSCAPPRAAGRYEGAVVRQPDGRLSLWIPDGTVVPDLVRVDLDASLESRVDQDLAECEGGVVRRRIAVATTGEEQVAASLVSTFAGLTMCPESSPRVPSADCEATQRLRYYQLREPCDAPCTVDPGEATGTLTCTCP